MKRIFRIRNDLSVALVLLVAASASGCAAPEYTKTEDPFKVATKSERLYSGAKICFLITDNTNKTLDYVNGLSNGMVGALGGMGGFDSRRIIVDFTSALQSRFRDAVRVMGIEELESRGCNLALSLDLKLKMTPGIRKTGWAEITAAFADAKGNRLDTFSAEAEGSDWNSLGGAGAAAWDVAVKAFIFRLDSSKPLLAFVSDLQPSASASTVTATPAAIDLAFWDSVKASKNPVDLQAYLQKFPNGSFVALARTRLQALGEAVPVRLSPLVMPVDSKVNFGAYHALVIGINNYKAVTPLQTAVNDAKTVADLLQKEYGFNVTVLLDATRGQILDAFDGLRRTLVETDNLLVYYAGHGQLDADSDRGFWLPVDADADRRANLLSNSDITDMVRATRAKHVLVVADSCYAGTLTRSLSVELSALDDMARLAQKRARTALVSGGLEPVADSGGGGHSVFAKAFLDALLANTGVVDMSQIFSSMRRQVILSAQQTPQYSDIRLAGHEGGDFIFVRRK